MILFNRIEYKNFKAVGNDPVIIELDKSKTTLITGKNGHGKSTMTSAICFALFGRDFSLNKDGLINTINLKKTEITLDFTIGKKKYKIIRGIKPNIFKIFEDDKLLNEDASSRDYQKILETQIIKMDFRAFKQVIVVGGKSYVPFMKLKAADRRDFIEDLLDIKIFSVMNLVLKDDSKILKEELRGVNEKLKTIKEKAILQESFIKKLSEEKNISTGKIGLEIKSLEDEVIALRVELNKHETDEELLEEKSSIFKNLSKDLMGVIHDQRTLETQKKKYQTSMNFYSTTEVCPTCTQNVDSGHREIIILDNENSLDLCETSLIEKNKKVDELQSKVILQEKFNKIMIEKRATISIIKNKILTINELIKKAKEQIKDLEGSTSSLDSEKAKLKEFLIEFKKHDDIKKSFLDEQQYFELGQATLVDIKPKIIKQYIPNINKLINHYLGKLDFWVQFNIDENFNEVIKSRYRDTFTYENFSDGQQSRIDLALMFAWRDIAKMRNAVNVNLCIFDEADAAMDIDGSSLMTDLVSMFTDSNVFIISHKEAMRDKVDRTIQFKLVDNFSVIVDNQ